MKKIILPVLIGFMIFTASCGNSPSESTDATAANDSADNNEAAVSDVTPQKEDIYGSIKEIVGNLATIQLAVMTENGIPVPGERQMRSFNAENLPEGMEIPTNEDGSYSIPEGAQRRFSMDGGDGNFTIPEGAEDRIMGEGGVASFSFGDASGGQGGITRNEDGSITLPDGSTIAADDIQTRIQGVGMNTAFLEYTGEEVEFILPVGTPIYAVTKDEEGNQVETEIALEDIANNNVISVTYKSDGKTIDKILVSQVTAAARPEGWALPEGMEATMEDGGGEVDE